MIFKVLARYTVREIFSSKRAGNPADHRSGAETEVLADGILLRAGRWARSNCRMTIGAAWKSCWLKS